MPAEPLDKPGVIAPPPLLYLGAFLLGLSLDWTLALPGPLAALGSGLRLRLGLGLGSWVRLAAAVGLGLAGAALALPALRGFRRAGTSPEPWRPSTALVVEGLYRYSRNPMYLGMTVLYLGLAVAVDSLGALLLLVPLLLVVRYGVIGPEERYLEARFGEAYRDYKARVRRWL